ncbi:ATP-binding protein [Gorillibacterium sp. sgz500922]|uniref:sensor histidine kinase n=1 Tax=Gorillibacterium sp. sgz500922 TaxID=3446694 RepID=UPI003F67AC77
MAKNKIGLKLGLVILTAFAVVILLLGWTTNRMFTNFYTAEMRTEAEELTAHFAAMSESPELMSEEALLTFADFSNVRVLYVSRQGQIVAHSGPDEALDPMLVKSEELAPLFAGGKMEREYTDAKGERYYLAARAVLNKTGEPGQTAVYVLSSTRHMDESIAAVRRVLALAGAGAFLLALGITWIIAIRVSSPLLAMQAATRSMAAGDLETRLAVHGKDEMGALAESINHLAIGLQRYRDSRQEFFANISHELRTPIAYLEGYAEVLRKGLYESEAERDAYLDIVHEEAVRLQRLVDDLFELAKMEEGKISLSLEWIDLAELAQSAVQKIKLKADEKRLTLQTKLNSQVPLLYGDGLRMEQVLLNLLENAVRYTEKGSILVELDERPEYAFMAVEDTGIGIPEAELSNIFERFYRVEKSRSRQHGGTGLGLPLAKKLVELQGGQLLVFSQPGRGTRFEIRWAPERGEEQP